ncbi:MAG: hypothetical protein V4707_05475 [Pseudomonadota bacterium]
MITSLMAAAALMGAGDPDGVIVTAPNGMGASPVAAEAPVVQMPPRQSAAHGLTTDEQIEAWIAARREADDSLPFEGQPVDDRQVHGEISVGIGTGGYRAYGGSVSLPVGERGRVDLHYSQVENDPYARYYRYDPYWDQEASGEPWGYRQAAEEAPAPPRPDRALRR